ncbi:MAG: hypothetical protein WAN36_14795 [Calditrichia bacterium]
MKINPDKAAGILLLLLFIFSCEHFDAGLSRPDKQQKVLIRFQSQQIPGMALQQHCISVTDSIFLQVTESNGQSRSFHKKITPGQETTEFSLEVEAGQTEFLADITSNTGAVLYHGQRTADIQNDNFRVNVPLVAVSPVLAVCYDSLVVSPEIHDFFVIHNRGAGLMEWDAGGGNIPVSILPGSGYLAAQEIDTVYLAADTAGYLPGLYMLPIVSESGFIRTELKLLPGTPDLAITNYQCLNNEIIRVSVQNKGSAATNIPTEIKIAFNTSGGLSEEIKTLPVLKRNEETIFDFVVPNGCFIPDCYFQISIDFDDLIKELDEENNTAVGACLG